LTPVGPNDVRAPRHEIVSPVPMPVSTPPTLASTVNDDDDAIDTPPTTSFAEAAAHYDAELARSAVSAPQRALAST
jgi:hypothetical protein